MNETEESPKGSRASTKEKHDFLIGVLKETRAGVIDFMFKQGAVITLLMGWVISSPPAQKFFLDHTEARYAAAAGVIVLGVFLAYWVLSYRKRSQDVCKFLLDLGYMPKEFYADLVITKRFAISLIILYAVACLVVLICLFCISQGSGIHP